jgi:hypothetical protein
MSDSGNKIVDVAKGEIGKTDETRYGADPNELWCSEFVSWVYWQAGYPFTGGPSGKRWHLSSVKKIKAWFKSNSTFISKDSSDWFSFTPTPGDYVCFGNTANPESHSGIVEYLDSNDTLHTIEGNAGDKVARKSYSNFRTNVSFSKWVQGLGLRCGKRIRIPNGTASASSSGDNREPYKAFDSNNGTWWRNRTKQSGQQYLQMEWTSKKTVTKISLEFGNHYPRDYRFYFKKGPTKSASFWIASTTIKDNPRKSRAHVWFTPMKNVWGVRIKCLRYAKDDYFSVMEMVIQR